MTPIVRRFIKTALFFLVLGLSVGVFMLVRRELFGAWPGSYVISAHTHAVFVGFVMFMILGVALWLFPKPLPGDTNFRPILIELVYWLLLAGTLGRFVGELLRSFADDPALGWLIVFAGVFQLSALLVYVWTMWRRIRPSARQLRLGQGGEPD